MANRAVPIGTIPKRLVELALQYKSIQPPSVALAQCIIESSDGDPADGQWFDSTLALEHNNVFGHKWVTASKAAGSVSKLTHEWIGGVRTPVDQKFASYSSLSQCFEDHARIMRLAPYMNARAWIRNPDQYAKRLSGVYSTDPTYGDQLIAIMKRYNLYQYDTKVVPLYPVASDIKVGRFMQILVSVAATVSKWLAGIVALGGKKKWLSFLIGIVSVIFNHFALGKPDADIDQLIVGLSGLYMLVEGALDAVRALVAKSGGDPALVPDLPDDPADLLRARG